MGLLGHLATTRRLCEVRQSARTRRDVRWVVRGVSRPEFGVAKAIALLTSCVAVATNATLPVFKIGSLVTIMCFHQICQWCVFRTTHWSLSLARSGNSGF